MTLTRCCTKCQLQLPLAEFALRHDRNPGDRLSQCRECYRARRRAYQARKPAPIEQPNERDEMERVCNVALMSWRECEVGANLTWRIAA